MANSVIQYAYVSGEISPKFFGRTDLEKYDLGLSQAHNWLVDYRGGMVTRPGSEFKEWLQHPTYPVKAFAFEFSPDVANTNVVWFGHGYIRFTQEGQYVLEATKAISAITIANPGVVTVAAHGFATGDMVKIFDVIGPTQLNGRCFDIEVLTVNTFRLRNQFGELVSTIGMTAFTSGSLGRVYTVASPYSDAALENLKVEQNRDLLRLTHYNYRTQDLRRLAAANWTLTPTQFSAQITAPSGLTGSGSGAAFAGVAFCVTAVDFDGNESQPSEVFLLTGIVNYSVTAGSALFGWSPVAGAKFYNVYRSTIFVDGNRLSRSVQLGLLGRAKGATFVDTNIIPNFSLAPPEYNNPFADAPIKWIDVTAGGAGYLQTSTVTITDGTGTGATAYPIVDAAGAVTGIVVTNGGEGYSGPTITISDGAGATTSVELGSAFVNYPSTSTVFQQRQVYAGTLANPLGIFGSRPGRFNNFDNSAVIVDNDSYEFEVDSRQVSTIQHLRSMRGGLLVMNQVGVWQLTGGSQIAVTPTNAFAEPQSYTGVSELPPIQIESDLLYCESKGFTARLLSYNDLAKLYAGTDISILSAHLFGKYKEIVSWTYAQDPFKVVHAIRADGVRLYGTIVKDQNVFSWTPTTTQGYYKQAITVRENREDRVYLDVLRKIKGVYVRYIELEAPREFSKIEDAWALDSALALQPTYPFANVTPSALSGTNVLLTASAGVFGSSDVGKIIFGGGGKAIVTTYVSATQVYVNVIRPFTKVIFETETPDTWFYTQWTMDLTVLTISGLHHLEGETVSILADGNVMPSRQVVNGQVTLDAPVTRAIIGLSYSCIARTLPMTVKGALVEDKRKRICGVATRVFESRGLLTGTDLNSLYESKDRTTETYGQPIMPRNDMMFTAVEPNWDVDGRFYLVVKDPLPVTILGHVISMEVGDDEA